MSALPAKQDVLFEVPSGQAGENVADGASDQSTGIPATAPKVAAPKSVRVKSKAELEREGVKRIYVELRGEPYKAVPQDHQAWTDLKKVALIEDIEQRWRIGLAATGWLKVNTIWELGRKWNDLAGLVPRMTKSTDSYVCETCGATVDCATQGRLWIGKRWICSLACSE